MEKTPFIWKNGQWIAWEEATTHVLTHTLHYGTGVFEGIRAYETEKGSAIFKARDHFERLLHSARIYEIKLSYTVDDLILAAKDLLRKNGLSSCYIRPLVYYGFREMGLNPGKNPVEVIIAAWKWGTYLGEEGLKHGVRCKISSWTRIDGRMLPTMAKCCANYANSALAKLEALNCGYDEAILLNLKGTIAEGPGENIILVKDGKLCTPPLSDQILFGITCQSAIQIAKDLGYEVEFRSITREELFLADELFFTGTAAEITPIREIDGRVIGSGTRGPITERIQSQFFAIVHGKDNRYANWLDYIGNLHLTKT